MSANQFEKKSEAWSALFSEPQLDKKPAQVIADQAKLPLFELDPVGGSAAIYGRDGILAHTYMLGPNGDSNGCVSIRNYDRFLQAYLRGEVKRLVVVTGRGQDVLPRIVNRRTGRAT